MGHMLFIGMHLVAALFLSVVWLLLTLPLHLIYGVIAGNASRARARERAAQHADASQIRCPECRELVRHDARKCKHCGATLTPPEEHAPADPLPPGDAEKLRGYVLMSVAVMLCALMLTMYFTRK